MFCRWAERQVHSFENFEDVRAWTVIKGALVFGVAGRVGVVLVGGLGGGGVAAVLARLRKTQKRRRSLFFGD